MGWPCYFNGKMYKIIISSSNKYMAIGCSRNECVCDCFLGGVLAEGIPMGGVYFEKYRNYILNLMLQGFNS